jgi:NhaP-type Na+/H+ or K+/H+ antiporter
LLIGTIFLILLLLTVYDDGIHNDKHERKKKDALSLSLRSGAAVITIFVVIVAVFEEKKKRG